MSTSKYFSGPARMSARKSPAHEEDHAAADAALKPINVQESLEKMFAEMSKMNNVLQSVATDVSSIKQTTEELSNTVTAMQERLGEAEARIVHLEETSEQLLNDKESRDKQTELLWNRVQALENQSRRNNVRLVGLKETFGTNGTLLDCVQKILVESLGVGGDGELEIEGAQAAGTDAERRSAPETRADPFSEAVCKG